MTDGLPPLHAAGATGTIEIAFRQQCFCTLLRLCDSLGMGTTVSSMALPHAAPRPVLLASARSDPHQLVCAQVTRIQNRASRGRLYCSQVSHCRSLRYESMFVRRSRVLPAASSIPPQRDSALCACRGRWGAPAWFAASGVVQLGIPTLKAGLCP